MKLVDAHTHSQRTNVHLKPFRWPTFVWREEFWEAYDEGEDHEQEKFRQGCSCHLWTIRSYIRTCLPRHDLWLVVFLIRFYISTCSHTVSLAITAASGEVYDALTMRVIIHVEAGEGAKETHAHNSKQLHFLHYTSCHLLRKREKWRAAGTTKSVWQQNVSRNGVFG